MCQPIEFPPAPEGYYFQIKNGLEDRLDAPRWRVVLMRKRWIFPIEVGGTELEHLTSDKVRSAALQTIQDFQLRQEARQANHQRKQLNRKSRP